MVAIEGKTANSIILHQQETTNRIIHGDPYTQIEFINLILETQFHRQQNLSFYECVLMSEDKFDYSIVAIHLQINISFRIILFKFYFMAYDGWRMVNDEC